MTEKRQKEAAFAMGRRAIDQIVRARTASRLLDAVESTGAKIIYIAAFEDAQRVLYTEINRRNWAGRGYAYLSALPSANALFDAQAEADANAIYGQLGSLGFQENDPPYDGDHEPTTA